MAPCATDAAGMASCVEHWGVGRCVMVVNGRKAAESEKTLDSPLRKEAADNDTNNE